MTPSQLAGIHASAFSVPRPWSADEFKDLLNDKTIFLCTKEHGFLMGRVIANEAELLTIAVSPFHRRQGIARQLMDDFLHETQLRQAMTVFLEVAADNTAAKKLYSTYGFSQTGLRKKYYANPNGQRVDAIVMGLKL